MIWATLLAAITGLFAVARSIQARRNLSQVLVTVNRIQHDADRGWTAARDLMVKRLDYEVDHAEEVIEAWRGNPWLDDYRGKDSTPLDPLD